MTGSNEYDLRVSDPAAPSWPPPICHRSGCAGRRAIAQLIPPSRTTPILREVACDVIQVHRFEPELAALEVAHESVQRLAKTITRPHSAPDRSAVFPAQRLVNAGRSKRQFPHVGLDLMITWHPSAAQAAVQSASSTRTEYRARRHRALNYSLAKERAAAKAADGRRGRPI